MLKLCIMPLRQTLFGLQSFESSFTDFLLDVLFYSVCEDNSNCIYPLNMYSTLHFYLRMCPYNV